MTTQERAFAAWVRQQPCAIRMQHSHHDICTHRSEAAHVKTRGARGGWFNNLVPLCRIAHAEQHAMGVKSFQAKYHYAMEAHAIHLYATWRDGEPFIQE